MRRRHLIPALAGLAAPAAAQSLTVTVWRDPGCGCCGGWIRHLRSEGFSVQDHTVPDLTPHRARLGTPDGLLSCHAARIAGFGLEGHVPVLAIRRLLAERPAGVLGLAVPGMPVGSPGMEVPRRDAEPYDVMAWRADGSSMAWMRMRGTRLA
ncbi:MAG: DUF411 domain-containing protein [Acetobacteraceae bacterium]|nr:DUF411 domain-containing protein [Acetobacteraceae bacterium]